IGGLSGYLQESFHLAYLAVYLAGAMVSFTPCVYPPIPITVAFIGAHGSVSRGRAFLLSLVYVLGLATTYTALGAAAALSGKLFGQIQSHPWTYFFIGNLCIIMGLSMLGVFAVAVRTPSFLTRIQRESPTKGISSSFLVGAISGFVMSPCTAPALAVVLGYAATRENLVFASSLMFVFALGMGTLLILLGTFAGMLTGLPRSGAWMTRISRLFGWLLIGTGEYFLIKAGMLWI
ncbi:MAG: sulfite exporter TauE/SafE family protein, partial [Syntrophaceae bacterium]|nr:sulfite exporter TauE/SafE family protein [Syntrophaceae bacterium]